jgi:hypothetical protein
MKHKTSELTGALLDAAVAKAEGREFRIMPREIWGDGCGITFVHDRPVCQVGTSYFKPSTDWSQGGPIVDREIHTLIERGGLCQAECFYPKWPDPRRFCYSLTGPTLLVAAMRTFVASRLGAEVDL